MRVFAIALAMVLLMNAAALGKPATPSGKGTEQQQADNPMVQEPKRVERGTETAPLVVKNYPQQGPEDVKQAKEDRQERAEADWWAIIIGKATIVVGLLTFFILVVQAIVFGVQAKRLRDSVNEMRSATEATMKVANSLKGSNRAWLIMEDAKIRGLDADDPDVREKVDAIFRIENRGSSPAFVTEQKFLFVCRKKQDNWPTIPDYGKLAGCERMPIGDGKFRYEGAPLSQVIMDDDIKRIINEELVLWLYGIVKYDDVFGEPHEHRFCIRWVVEDFDAFRPNIDRGRFVYESDVPSQYNRHT